MRSFGTAGGKLPGPYKTRKHNVDKASEEAVQCLIQDLNSEECFQCELNSYSQKTIFFIIVYYFLSQSGPFGRIFFNLLLDFNNALTL